MQLVWGKLPEGQVTIEVCARNSSRGGYGGSTVTLNHVGGAGGAAMENLPSDTELRVHVGWEGGRTVLDFKTLAAPQGERLGRFATVSDMHLGVEHWGVFKSMTDNKASIPAGVEERVRSSPSAFRCGQGAIEAANTWGASQILVKGDSANHQSASCFEELDELLDLFPTTPFHLIPGNHDVDTKHKVDVPASFGSQKTPLVRTHDSFDINGLRIIMIDSTVEGMGPGSVTRHKEAVVELASQSPTPVFLATHHHFQERKFPTYWPLGIPKGEASVFLDALGQANPNVIVTSGHTHRNRVRRHGNVVLTQVASTRDWPGVWAGYTVYEGGLVQTVRRITKPGAIHWHEYSKDAVGGLWRFWADGAMDQRSFCHRWI